MVQGLEGGPSAQQLSLPEPAARWSRVNQLSQISGLPPPPPEVKAGGGGGRARGLPVIWRLQVSPVRRGPAHRQQARSTATGH